jgi:hypothetical protein
MAEPAITIRAVHDSGSGNLPINRVVIHSTCPNVGYPAASAPGAAHGTALYFTNPASGGSAVATRSSCSPSAWACCRGCRCCSASPRPGSTNALLGPVLVHVWAWILVAGCATALIGVWWTWFGWCPWVRPTPGTGLLVERVGLVAVGVGTLIYAAAILAEAPGFRLLPAAIVAAYGLACWWRAFLIQRWIRATISRRPQ